MDERSEVIPVSEAFDQLKARGYDIGFDKWQRWVAAGLLPGSEVIENTNVRGLGPVTQQRICLLLEIERWLDSQKPSAAELAFWMAFYGDTNAPPDLVALHIESGVRSITVYVRRMLKLRQGDNKMRRDKKRKRLLKLVQATGKLHSEVIGVAQSKQSFIGQALGRFYESFVLSYLTNDKITFLDRPLVRLFLMFGDSRKTAKDLKDIALEGLAATRDFLRAPRDGKNVLLSSIREANRESRVEIVPICRCANYTVAGLGKIIDALANPEKYSDQMGKPEIRLIKYKLPVACAAMLVHLRGERFTRRMMAQMQSGTFELFNEQFNILSRIKTEFGRRFGNAPSSE